MARKRRKSKEETEPLEQPIASEDWQEVACENITKALESAKEESRATKKEQIVIITKPESFESWWIKAQTEKGLSPGLKQALRIYFTQKGHMKTGDFDKGLKEFGF